MPLIVTIYTCGSKAQQQQIYVVSSQTLKSYAFLPKYWVRKGHVVCDNQLEQSTSSKFLENLHVEQWYGDYFFLYRYQVYLLLRGFQPVSLDLYDNSHRWTSRITDRELRSDKYTPSFPKVVIKLFFTTHNLISFNFKVISLKNIQTAPHDETNYMIYPRHSTCRRAIKAHENCGAEVCTQKQKFVWSDVIWF